MKKILFIRPNRDSFGFKPINLSILSALAKVNGWDTQLFDTTYLDLKDLAYNSKNDYIESKIFKPVDYSDFGVSLIREGNLEDLLISDIEKYKPELFCFSVLSDQFNIAANISEIIKKNSDAPIIWGGVHPTVDPINSLNYADYICIGEGLEAFPEFLSNIETIDKILSIKNIWGWDNGKIVKNSLRPLKENMDDLPFLDWDIFEKRDFLKPFDGKAYIGGDHMITWGCPNRCSYCINYFYQELYKNETQKPYTIRRYSEERIISELKWLKEKYNLEFLKFHDENFLLGSLKHLTNLSQLYRENVDIPFSVMCNAKTITKEKVKILKEMGCASVSIGLEAGNEEYRHNLLNRIETRNEILSAFKICNEFNLRNSAFNMLALPRYSEKIYWDTIKLNRDANVQYPNANFFFPYQGTKLREIAINERFYDPDKSETSVYRLDKPALKFENLSEESLLHMQRSFVLYVKLPENFKKYIKRTATNDVIGKKLRDKLDLIYENTVWKNNGWYNQDKRITNIFLSELEIILKNEPEINL